MFWGCVCVVVLLRGGVLLWCVMVRCYAQCVAMCLVCVGCAVVLFLGDCGVIVRCCKGGALDLLVSVHFGPLCFWLSVSGTKWYLELNGLKTAVGLWSSLVSGAFFLGWLWCGGCCVVVLDAGACDVLVW